MPDELTHARNGRDDGAPALRLVGRTEPENAAGLAESPHGIGRC